VGVSINCSFERTLGRGEKGTLMKVADFRAEEGSKLRKCFRGE